MSGEHFGAYGDPIGPTDCATARAVEKHRTERERITFLESENKELKEEVKRLRGLVCLLSNRD